MLSRTGIRVITITQLKDFQNKYSVRWRCI